MERLISSVTDHRTGTPEGFLPKRPEGSIEHQSRLNQTFGTLSTCRSGCAQFQDKIIIAFVIAITIRAVIDGEVERAAGLRDGHGFLGDQQAAALRQLPLRDGSPRIPVHPSGSPLGLTMG